MMSAKAALVSSNGNYYLDNDLSTCSVYKKIFKDAKPPLARGPIGSPHFIGSSGIFNSPVYEKIMSNKRGEETMKKILGAASLLEDIPFKLDVSVVEKCSDSECSDSTHRILIENNYSDSDSDSEPFPFLNDISIISKDPNDIHYIEDDSITLKTSDSEDDGNTTTTTTPQK